MQIAGGYSIAQSVLLMEYAWCADEQAATGLETAEGYKAKGNEAISKADWKVRRCMVAQLTTPDWITVLLSRNKHAGDRSES